MNRGALFVVLVTIAPATGAAAWVPCKQPGIEAPIEAVAFLTLFFDPARATCPGSRSPDRDPPPAYRPAPQVTRTMKGPAAATTG